MPASSSNTTATFDRIVVRMKAINKSNKVVFYVNEKAISNAQLTSRVEGLHRRYPRRRQEKGGKPVS